MLLVISFQNHKLKPTITTTVAKSVTTESQAKADLNGDEDKGGNDNHDINNNYNDKISPQFLSVISFQNHKLKPTMTATAAKSMTKITTIS